MCCLEECRAEEGICYLLSAFRRVTQNFLKRMKLKGKMHTRCFLKTEFGFFTSSCLPSYKLSKNFFIVE